MSITAKELAGLLGLSPAAVSMALNNKPGVSRETRRRVLETARQHGYDFTRLSQKQQTTGSIYFVIFKKHGAVVADTPFFSQLSDGVNEGCRSAGYKVNIRYLYDDMAPLAWEIETIGYSDCCGVILLGTEMHPADFTPFSALPVPIVILDTYFETVPGNYVLINNVQGAYLAALHLARSTGQQPGYLRSSYSIGNFEERAHGFYNAIRACGLSTSKSVVHQLAPSIEGAYSDMQEILNRGDELARCYFADNDLIAIGAMRALKEHGCRIPEDVAIIGFDNISTGQLVEPSLSTVHVPKLELGRVAAARLIEIIEKKTSTMLKTQISTTLVLRGSAK